MLYGGALAALMAIAPPLGLLALIETGEGKDTDCGRSIAPAGAETEPEPSPPARPRS